MLHPLAGKPAPPESLVNVPKLVRAYYALHPDAADPLEQVAFGTSGHRGSSFSKSFNEDHICAITRAICEFRSSRGITGPLFLGIDTHALSEPSFMTALEVLAAHGVDVMIQKGRGYTPTPVISHAIVTYNRGRESGLADGIVITPSHNPPEDGGFKYNPPHGGPADVDVTRWVQARANDLIRQGLKDVKRVPFEKAVRAGTTYEYDYVKPFVEDLQNVIETDVIRGADIRIGADPMGGSSIAFWGPIAERYGFAIDVVNRVVDPTFSFMTLDHDGKIRTDCSSPYAMAGLIALKDRYDIAFGNDADCDRHGIVTRSAGLMNPNHYLAVSIWYLFQNRRGWRRDAAIGKTLVSSSMIDRVAKYLGKRLFEVPVGFKWFVRGLMEGTCAFGGEESAGAAFLRKDGTVWTTDKDGIIMGLLSAEITARTGRDPAEHYRQLTGMFGDPLYERMDMPASPGQKMAVGKLSPDDIVMDEVAGEKIIARLTRAPANNALIGGLKVVTENGWFAVRPSGTENVIKIYTESFRDRAHLEKIQGEVLHIIEEACRKAGT
ncbi:MAG: phosphoglucomutase (alpha-D-glucose-1,6-bisphosphate-dependent) [Deltaproteobacteria bacterium]|nr:phosphoglucomutase (alpha-D-glucose-1,6-bisphosphate-dependent) [Deltaproteobacteria bacterium]